MNSVNVTKKKYHRDSPCDFLQLQLVYVAISQPSLIQIYVQRGVSLNNQSGTLICWPQYQYRDTVG